MRLEEGTDLQGVYSWARQGCKACWCGPTHGPWALFTVAPHRGGGANTSMKLLLVLACFVGPVCFILVMVLSSNFHHSFVRSANVTQHLLFSPPPSRLLIRTFIMSPSVAFSRWAFPSLPCLSQVSLCHCLSHRN